MILKILSVAVFAAVTGVTVSQAQTIAQIGGPAELPPASYKGDQFIDSRGCVFMRISNGANSGWYPRVNSSRKVVCGYPPTFGPKPVIEMADETPAAPVAPAPVAAKPAPQVAAKTTPGAPTATVASRMMPAVAPVVAAPVVVAAQPMPYVAAAPASYQVATSAAVPAGSIGCFRSAPVAEVATLRGGGTVVVCTRGDGTTTGWRAPIYPTGAPVGASLRAPGAVAYAATVQTAAPVAAPSPVALPKGYKLAWKDDRLNPLRGQGTAAGQAAQDQIWTRTVPARLVSEVNNHKVAVAPVYKAQVTTSSKSATSVARSKITASSMNGAGTANRTAKPAAAAKLWVQVGSFAAASNAQAAVNRLAGLGLSVGKSTMTRGGKTMQIVFAGPFASTTDAQRAAGMAQKAGFADAFVR